MGAIVMLGSVPQAGAAGDVIPLSAESKKELALLGEGVVGKPVPAVAIGDPAKFSALRPGVFTYKVVGGDKKGKTYTETFKQIPATERGATWSRAWDTYLDHIKLHDDKVTLVASTDEGRGYISDMMPHGDVLAANLEPGQSMKTSGKLQVFKKGKLDDPAYSGTWESDITYEGVYEVTTPAGTFDAALFRDETKIHVGPAHVEDTRYSFIAKGVGKVAAIEHLHISALLIYHSNKRTPVVLVDYPGMEKKR
jgi:hypothetical protein